MITNAIDPALVQQLQLVFPNATGFGYLGEGAFGVTYRVDEPAGQTAIKILKPPYDIARTEREVTSLMAVESRYVSRFIDTGSFHFERNTLRYIRTEFLGGQTLRARLGNGRLSEAELRRLIQHMARGLEALHACGLTHRDLKPENIMLDGQRCVIIDLGFVKVHSAATLTINGDFVGTPQYAALEQLRSARHVDIRADLFSLGMVMYEAAHGSLQFAFHAGRQQTRNDCMQNLLSVALVDMEKLGSLASIVTKLLAVQAYNRTNSPRILIEELGSI